MYLRPRPTTAASVVWLMAGAGYLILEAISAAGYVPAYSYSHNSISDLGARGSRAHLMNMAFVLQGTLFLTGALLLVRAVRMPTYVLFLGLATANAVGNILVATFHSAAAPSAAGPAWLHVTGAALAIVGGNAAILAGSSRLRDAGFPRWYVGMSIAFAALGILSLLILLAASSTLDGVWERLSVYTILAWQMFTASWLFRLRCSEPRLRPGPGRRRCRYRTSGSHRSGSRR